MVNLMTNLLDRLESEVYNETTHGFYYSNMFSHVYISAEIGLFADGIKTKSEIEKGTIGIAYARDDKFEYMCVGKSNERIHRAVNNTNQLCLDTWGMDRSSNFRKPWAAHEYTIQRIGTKSVLKTNRGLLLPNGPTGGHGVQISREDQHKLLFVWRKKELNYLINL